MILAVFNDGYDIWHKLFETKEELKNYIEDAGVNCVECIIEGNVIEYKDLGYGHPVL